MGYGLGLGYEGLAMQVPKSVLAVITILLAGLVAYVVYKSATQVAEIKEIKQQPRIEQQAPSPQVFQKEYTASQLAKLFNDNKNAKEKITGKQVVVNGRRTLSQTTRDTFKSNSAVILLDGSPDGVTSGNVMCWFSPAIGGRFAASFLQWLDGAPDGTDVSIEGEIFAVEQDGVVTFSLKKCRFVD